MEYLASNTLPLIFIGSTVAAYVAYQNGACSKKAKYVNLVNGTILSVPS